MFFPGKNNRFGPVDNSLSPKSHWKTLAFKQVRLTSGFWVKRAATNRNVSLFYAFEMLEKAGNLDNLRIAAGLKKGEYQGYVFLDSDIYKWLEATAWEMGNEADERLASMVDQAIDLIKKVQRPDGYINSYVQTREQFEPWADLDNGHEMYCAGHLIQAAVAFKRALDDDRLLDVACRFADAIDKVFGPGKRQGSCGHPIIEMALVELFRVTGEKRYLNLAKFLIDQRGKNRMKGHRSYGPEYQQDHVPVRQVVEAEGHAVRQLYLASGVTDLFLETGELALLEAMTRLSKDITETKLYITGGMGARFDGESFGEPYELPNDQCYCETCAAIASFMWNWRMLLATGDGLYADQMEKVLYNNILSGPALDGTHFFYINPLMLREARFLRLSTDLPPSEVFIPDQRPKWHDCACCPPNVMRLVSSITHYLATQDRTGIQVHHYASSDISMVEQEAKTRKIRMTTDYPWQGKINLKVLETDGSSFRLSLRIPAWSESFHAAINGVPIDNPHQENGYLVLEKDWQPGDEVTLDLGMAPMLIASHPRIDANRGCLAIQRGPLVYCLEDQDQEVKDRLLDVEINPNQPLTAQWENDLLDGIMAIHAKGRVSDHDSWRANLYQPLNPSHKDPGKEVDLMAVPYYTWANRGIGGMRVWIPIQPSND